MSSTHGACLVAGVAGCVILLCLCPVGSSAAGFNANYTATVAISPDKAAVVAVPDIFGNCMDTPAPGANSTTGSLAIENPHDKAYLISDISFEVCGKGSGADSVFFTLNRFSERCAILRDTLNPRLSLASFANAPDETRALAREMLAGMEYIHAQSVKHYNFLEATWGGQLPGDMTLNMYITLVPVGIDGTVFLDADADGVQSPTEAGIPGAQVLLLGEDGSVSSRCYSDYRGYYHFPSPKPGRYTVKVRLPAGYSFASGEAPPPGSVSSGALDLQPTAHLRWDIPLQLSGLERVGGLAEIKRQARVGYRIFKDNT